MYLFIAIVLLALGKSASLSNTTTIPTDTGPGHAQKPNATTAVPVQVKQRSQKELLGSIGVFNRTALSNGKKTSDTTGKPTTQKPVDQKSLLGSFGSFFAKPKAKPDKQTTPSSASPKPEPQACVIVDMCKAMNGICNKGTCVHIEKNCEGDMKCDCHPGYKGQFCSIAIADVPPSTTKPAATPPKPTTAASHNTNGKQHVNGNVDRTKIVSDSNATSTSISGSQNETGSAAGKNDSSTNKGVGSKKSKDGSYRKGPETSIIADNSPIRLDATSMGSHKIKTGNVSIISSTTDTVTFATVSVKNTFIGAVHGQTARLRGPNPNTNKDKKTSGSINSRKKNKVPEKPTTEKPTTTTEAPHTKKVIVDSSNNITIKSVRKSNIKTQKQTVVKETKGSVDIKNSTHIVQSAEARNTVVRQGNIKPKDVPKSNVRSSQSQNKPPDVNLGKDALTRAAAGVDIGNPKFPSKPKLSKKSTKTDKISSVPKTKSDVSASTKGGPSKSHEKKQNVPVNEPSVNGTAGETKDQPSVFSPIIDLLQKLESPTLLQKALDSKHAEVNPEATKGTVAGVNPAAVDTPAIGTADADSSVKKQSAPKKKDSVVKTTKPK